MNKTTFDSLVAFPGQLEAHYAAVPRELKAWSPASWEGIPSEPLSAIEQICHVRDIEVDGYHLRFHRTLTESNPTLPSLDAEALARERAYATSSDEAALLAFRAARSKTVSLLRNLTTEQFNRPATFEGYGTLTLCSLVHYLCSHDQQHLAGLQWLLGKISASRVQHASTARRSDKAESA